MYADTSQPVEVLDDRPITQFLHRQWEYEKELPMGRITDVHVSKDGLLWLCSFDGIFQFDGETFKRYSDSGFSALEGGCLSMHEDSEGIFWIGGNGNGILRFHEGSFSAWGVNDGLDYSTYYRLYSDWAGQLVVPGKTGLQTIEDEEVKAYRLEGIDDLWIREVCFMSDGSVYLGLWEGAIIHLEYEGKKLLKKTVIQFSSDISGKPRALAEGKDGAIWMGLDSGVIVRMDVDGRFSYFHPSGNPSLDTTFHFEVDAAGVLWAGSDFGLVRIVDDHAEWMIMDSQYEHDTIIDISFTEDGSLYCCSYSSGLHLMSLPKLGFMTEKDGLSSAKVNAVIQDSSGDIWIGTNNGIDVFRNGVIEHFRRDLFGGIFIRDLYWDREGRLWVAALRQFVACVDGDDVRIWMKEDGLPSNRVRVIGESQDGTIWIGSQDGLIRIDEEGELSIIRDSDGLGSNYVLSLFNDSRDRLWVGLAGGGLVRIEDGELTQITQGTKADSAVVFGVSEGSDGRIFAGWTGGVIVVDEDDTLGFFSIGTEGGKEAIFGICQDGSGDYWLPGNRAIKRVRKEAFDRFIMGESDTLEYERFDSQNALPSKLIRANARSCLDNEGRLWIPLGGGVAVIDPENIGFNPIPPRVRIRSVELDHSNQINFYGKQSQTLVIEPGVHILRIEFSGISHQSQDLVRFKVRLKGFEDWVKTTRKEAVYTNLKPKHYQFEVLGCNADGVWTQEPVVMDIIVKPAFYQHRLFLWIVFLLLILILWGLYSWRMMAHRHRSEYLEKLVDQRTRELKEQNEVIRRNNVQLSNTSRDLSASVSALKLVNENKNELLSLTAHDLKNSISAIVSSSALLEDSFLEIWGSDELAHKDERMLLGMISETGDDLLRTIETLLNSESKDMTQINLMFEKRILAEVVLSAIDINNPNAKDKKQSLVLGTVVTVDSFFDPLHIRMAIDNYISNAIKYSPRESQIKVVLEQIEENGVDSLKFSVRDQGPGLTDEDMKHVFQRFSRLSAKPTGNEHSSGIGLSIVKDVVEAHGGRVGVDSDYEKGAYFYFVIPCEISSDFESDPARLG